MLVRRYLLPTEGKVGMIALSYRLSTVQYGTLSYLRLCAFAFNATLATAAVGPAASAAKCR